ncbi:MAG: hypothetical protein POELPBGB_03099 [Bacteroidia bacterium]|nr:hypothetical protein [Bacteroidia bacterium]
MKKLLLLFLSFSLVLFSCKKKDEVSPYIQITSPNEYSNHNVLDTIAVVGMVSDNEQLEYIKLSLLNENNITVASVVTLFPETNEYELNREFIIDNILLESGEYNLLVTASDGENETRRYIEITLNEAVRELTGILIAETPAANSVELRKIKPDLSAEQIAFAAGDFSSAAASSKNQVYYIAGSETGSLRAFSMLNNSELWSVQANPLAGAPYFSDITEDDGLLYVSFFDGMLKVFDKSGTVKQQIDVSGYNCLKIYKQGNLIFSEQQQIGASSRRLVLYDALSAEEVQYVPLDMEAVAFCKRNDDNVFVFGNSGNQGYMKNYVISDNGFWEPHPLETGNVLSAVRIDDNTFLIGQEGTVYKYTYNPNSLVTYLPSVTASFISYELLSNRVVIADVNAVEIYNYNNGVLVGTVSAASAIKSLSLLYNK